MFCSRSLIPCRWGRATIQKAALFVTCTLLFTCLALMDMQMRCNSACRTMEGDTLTLLARALVSSPKNLRRQPQSSSNLSKGSRKLSSHAEELFLNDTDRDIFDDEEDGLDSKTSFVDFTLNLTEADGPTSPVHSTTAYLPRPKVRNSTVGRRLPHALIIGVKKGGTRALLEILRLHPDVRAPGPEPHFFDRHYHKGIDWYRRQMPLSLDNQLTMEKTPSYFITPEVPGRVFNLSRDIRLLVVVRDPVTRAVSDYTQASSKRRDTKTFEDMAFLNSSTGLVDTNWSAIKIGVYARHLDRWLKYFPLNHFHFVSGEKLISDPVTELEAVQDFLGLRKVICANHFFFNQTKGFPCLRRSLHSNVPHCLGKTKGRSHPYIPPSALQRLRDFYRPFNQKFYKVVGRNFNWF